MPWLSAAPTPGDLVPPCSITCGGFSSLRPECEQDACMGNNLCHLVDSTISSSGQTCAEWCCVSHNIASGFMVLMFCFAVFCVLLGCYYAQLHVKEERYLKEQAMSDAVEAATSGPSQLLRNARERLGNWTDKQADSISESATMASAAMEMNAIK